MSGHSYEEHDGSSYQRPEDTFHLRSRSRSRSFHRSRPDRYGGDDSRRRRRQDDLIRLPRMDSNLMPYRKFMDMQPEGLEPKRLKDAYDKYKQGWINKENQLFFDDHGEDAWFKEKYDPIITEILQTSQDDQIKQNAQLMIERIKSGQFETLDWTITQEKLQAIRNPDEEAERQEGLSNFQILLNDSFDAKNSPYFSFDPDFMTIFIKPVPKNISKLDLKKHFEKQPGFQSISLSQPLKKQDYVRYCWVSFSNQAGLNKALQDSKGLTIQNQNFNLQKSNSNRKKARFIKSYPKERLETDVKACLALIAAFDKRYGVQQNPIAQLSISPSKMLDFCQLYLRRAYAYDYFSAQRFTDQRLLVTKCGLIHFRIQISDPEYQVHNFLTKAQKQAYRKINQLSSYVKPKSAKLLILQRLSKISVEIGCQDCKCVINSCEMRFKKIADLQAHLEENHLSYPEKICKCMICKKRFKQPKFLAKHFQSKHQQVKTFKCHLCKQKFAEQEQMMAHADTKHPEESKAESKKEAFKRYSQDQNKITNNPMVLDQYIGKDDGRRGGPGLGRRPFRGGYRDRYRDRRRQPYNDLDDPTNSALNPANKPKRNLVNYLEI